MDVRIFPSKVCRSISAPPSKSMAHRLLICTGLAEGISRIHGISDSQDVLATCDCLAALGAKIRRDGAVLEIQGTDPRKAGPALLECRESGSTLRFFAPLCALSGETMKLTGTRRLLSRPQTVYETLFAKAGSLFDKKADSLTVRGPLSAGQYAMEASVSSQFISGMLMALPLLDGDSTIRLITPVESRSYMDMTMDAMRKTGVQIAQPDDLTLHIKGGQRYNAGEYAVEGDWSNAAFFLALGAEVDGLDHDCLQGDRVCLQHFRALDKGPAEIDITDCPDLGPVLMAYAALRHGARLTGTRRLRYKESDRGTAMKEELAKFGAGVDIEEDAVTVGRCLHEPVQVLSGHNDHRIVMALAVMCAETGGMIEGAEAVSKSYPDFWDRFRDAGLEAVTI